MVESHIDRFRRAPDWIENLELGEITGYIKTTRKTFLRRQGTRDKTYRRPRPNISSS